MYMIKAIIRPEKANIVLKNLLESGYPQATKIDVFGRGKQKGIRVGDVEYDELPKVMLLIAVNDTEKQEVIDIILNTAKTGQVGAYGDGKIFVSPIDEAYTISSGKIGL